MSAAHTPSADDLAAFVAAAEAGHAEQPATTLAALTARAPGLQPEAAACRVLALAEHLALAHLGDIPALAAFTAAVPAALAVHPDTAPATQRLQWVLAMAAGAPPAVPSPPDAVRWRALQHLVLALAWQGRWAEASALLMADEAAAQSHGQGEAGVAYAVSANNVALELQTGGPAGSVRTPERDALMLQAAATARRAWGHAGNWRHVERAEYRLALCHAAAGQGAAAVHHARLCVAGCEAAGGAADAAEHFFAQEALVHAQHDAGDAAAAAAARARMQALLPLVDTADGLRDWCAEALAALPG